MAYLVLARKYRPSKFNEVIGQEHITTLLEKAIESERIAHAYLFCGPRGIGKTSCARILAKSLNCRKGPTVTPCGECPACQEITNGTSFDVLEIDGASNRGIDEIRTLRENVRFAPNYGRYKIYIVDEVHMLTMEAFNALLKTLEEPPEHVKFIFATTDINKVPATIISRCQRFDFKRIPVKTIAELLADICKKEKLEVDQEALYAIAKAAQGSFRDALSILDQLSAINDRKIQTQDVFSMLGKVETQLLFNLADALSQKNCTQALQVLDEIIDQGKDIKQLSRDLTEHFRNLMIIKVGGKSLGKLVDYTATIKDMLLEQSQKFSLTQILNALDLFVEAQEVSRTMESLRMPLEIAFAKLIYSPDQESKEEISKGGIVHLREVPDSVTVKSVSPSKFSPVEVLKNQKGQVDFSIPNPNSDDSLVNTPEENLGQEGGQSYPIDLERIRRSWDAITYAISRVKMSVATFLQEGHPYEFNGNQLIIGFPNHLAFHKESLEDKATQALVEKIFSEKLRTKIIIGYKIIAETKPPDEEPFIQTALEKFQGKVVNKWHNE